MKRLLCLLAVVSTLTFVGCRDSMSPFSPRTQQSIENQNGRIDELETIQDSINTELEIVRNDATVNAEKLDNMQSGQFNDANSGIQIFQGDGFLITVVVLGGLAMILIYHFKFKADQKEKAAEILAQEIGRRGDSELENQVFLAAMNTDVEADIYKMITRHQKRH